ncbi:YciI family protein [Vampirovibrio sp.]|uniref:YciI family protein n=1 Tax=Vampirovibrio sp. TaxID=2717857 RepID=UPI0035942786
MFAVIVKYKKSMEEIELHTPAHRAFLDRYYEQGVLLISGRQNPPEGGVILAKAESRARVLEIFAEDPFQTEGVADYEIYEFTPTKFQPFLAEWLNA